MCSYLVRKLSKALGLHLSLSNLTLYILNSTTLKAHVMVKVNCITLINLTAALQISKEHSGSVG